MTFVACSFAVGQKKNFIESFEYVLVTESTLFYEAEISIWRELAFRAIQNCCMSLIKE